LATAGDDGTRVRVSEGGIAMCNAAGCLNLDSLQSGFSPNANTLPVRIAQAPNLQPTQAPTVLVLAPLETLPTVINEQGESRSPTVPLTNPGQGLLVTYSNSNTTFNAGVIGGMLTYDTQGRMLTFIDGFSTDGYANPGGNFSDFGSDGIIAWGRWNGGTTTTGNPATPVGSLSHLTYVTGNAGAAVPIVGTYSVFGSTSPLVIDGSNGGVLQVGTPNSVTGNMNVNFTGNSGGTLSYNLNIPVAGQTFIMNGNANQYSTVSFLGANSSISSSGSACSNGCSGIIPYGDAIQGAFFGAGNTRAGAQYGFSSGIGKITGAVVFQLGSPP
jgi:hypothetical protein